MIPQRGQVLRDGVLSVHDEARRIRVFDFDIFRFGTAMVIPDSDGILGARPPGKELKP